MNDLILTAISTAILVVSGFAANALYKLADAKRAEADLTKTSLWPKSPMRPATPCA